MDSRHSAFSYADMRLLWRVSRWLRTVVYFFSSDCLSAWTAKMAVGLLLYRMKLVRALRGVLLQEL